MHFVSASIINTQPFYIGPLQLNASYVFPFSLEKRAGLVPHLSLPPSRCESSQTPPQEKKPNKPLNDLFFRRQTGRQPVFIAELTTNSLHTQLRD